jgi:putative peptidoglycan lipid II flippase
MSEKKTISRATGVLGGATLLSRITGLMRDMVVGRIFGAGFATDAFFMAFTLPNLLRRFFAEGSMTAAFVPTFSAVLHKQGAEEARRVARICFTALGTVLLLVSLLGVLASPWVVSLIGPGFGDTAGKLLLTDLLNRIMFPYILFAGLLALASGILNVNDHYFTPAVSPVILNLAMIAGAAWLSPLFDPPIVGVALGVLAGGVLQVLMQWPVLARRGYGLGLDFSFRDPTLRRIAVLMVPGIAGVAIYQINVVITRLLASFLPQGSVSYLYYGQRLFEFPQGVFVVSLAQAVLPAMSRQAAAEDIEGLKQSLDFALKLITVVTLPAALGLMLCATPIYSVFFMGGAFDYAAVKQTSVALIAYAPGLYFLGMARVVVPTFYALQDTRTPVAISFWTLLINALLGVGLMQFYGHVGLALALTLATCCNAFLLVSALRRKIGPIGIRSLFSCFVRVLVPLAAMAVVVIYMLKLGQWSTADDRLRNGLVLALTVFSGALVYAVSGLLCKVSEISEGWGLLRSRLTRKKRR